MLDNEFKKSATEKVTAMSANEYKEAFKAIGSKPLTNEEWLRSCTTEQLVSFLLWYPNNVHGYPKPKMSIAEEEDVIREWLKQPHTEKE